MLRALFEDLHGLIEAQPDHPNLLRLRPPAYLDDPDADAAYQLLAGEELRTSHRAAIETMLGALDQDRCSEDDLWRWLQALNALRQVVGTRIGIDHDDFDIDEVDLEDEQVRAMWQVYEFATVLQHDIVDALGG